ncbi:glycosyltransferase [Serratia liquefaciens]|uniref:glycosyltransferase n=1 Tax=Serratia liquefaciens TaxID=614 RepID=UPI0021772190|nr:glycosyltransferase [Serratia liquefaciens]CAI0813297.1 UDP-galactofuranosyl transferase GlfT2 [Serratia liquefaciens]
MNQFTLQAATFPSEGVCTQASLYFHSSTKNILNLLSPKLSVPENETVSFDTFYNAFSLYKWRKYTTVDNLGFYANVNGRGIVTIYWIDGADTRIIYQSECSAGCNANELSLSGLTRGRLYFHWRSLEHSVITDFGFTTSSSVPQEKRLAIVITTFNRKQAVLSTLYRINEQLLNDTDFHNKVTLYIVNNGDDFSLPPLDNVVYLKSENFGGAGGFSRGLMEVKHRAREQFCLFMDDDASCEIESIKRAYRLLCFSNKKEQMVAGSMLYEERPGLVYEAGAIYPYKQLRMQPLKTGVDISTPEGLDEFDRDDIPANYAGWWFCAFDVSAIKYYAFPFFVRGDDILFGVMHGYEIITLNGISSWQMNFNRKYSPMAEYLSVRGLLVPAFIYPSFKKRVTIPYWVMGKVLLLCFSYRYSSAQAILEAYQDVLDGPDFWINDADASEARKRITALAQDEVANLSAPFVNAEWVTNVAQETRLHKAIRLCLLNGHLVPGLFFSQRNKRISNTEMHPTRHVFLSDSVFYYNTDIKKYIATQHNKSRFFKILIMTLKLLVRGFIKYPRIASLYKSKIMFLTSETFWKKHL